MNDPQLEDLEAPEDRKRRISALAIYANIEALHNKPQSFSATPRCAGKPIEWFTVSQKAGERPTKESDALNRSNLKKGLAICLGCPLMYNGECYDKAEPEDRKWTIRGGEIPEIWDQDNDRMPRSGRPNQGRCWRGHDRTLPENVDNRGGCRPCRRQRDADKYQETRTSLQVKGKSCRKGHDLTLPNATYSHRGDCAECKRIWQRAAYHRSVAARRERLAKSQADGVES